MPHELEGPVHWLMAGIGALLVRGPQRLQAGGPGGFMQRLSGVGSPDRPECERAPAFARVGTPAGAHGAGD